MYSTNQHDRTEESGKESWVFETMYPQELGKESWPSGWGELTMLEAGWKWNMEDCKMQVWKLWRAKKKAWKALKNPTKEVGEKEWFR